MKRIITLAGIALTTATLTMGCGRCVRTADDVTPGNLSCEKLDWRYGAGDIRIQTTNVCCQLMDRWAVRADPKVPYGDKPSIIITEIDNRTDQYISTDMVRDIIEGVAVNDGRFTVVVGDGMDEQELDYLMQKVQKDTKYNNSTRLAAGAATAPQFLGKIRITKAVTASRRYDFEDYRMTVTLYDIETQEVVDSAWDVLKKRVRA